MGTQSAWTEIMKCQICLSTDKKINLLLSRKTIVGEVKKKKSEGTSAAFASSSSIPGTFLQYLSFQKYLNRVKPQRTQ